MPSWDKFWQIEFLGNDLHAWAFALATFLVTLTVLPLLRRLISARRRHWAAMEAPQASRAAHAQHALLLAALLAERTSRLFLWAVAFYFASRDLAFAPRIERIITIAIVL